MRATPLVVTLLLVGAAAAFLLSDSFVPSDPATVPAAQTGSSFQPQGSGARADIGASTSVRSTPHLQRSGTSVSRWSPTPLPAAISDVTAARGPSVLGVSTAPVHSYEAPPSNYQPQSRGPKEDLGFRFVRVRYDSHRGYRRRAWATDYPEAEENLHEAIDRTTGLYLEGPPIVLRLTDERIFEYPVLYLTEPGYWRTNDEEVEALKKYLARGGFLIIDDFHDYGRGRVGPQWNNMYQNIKQVFPDREPIELTAEHPIWAIYYDIDPDAAISTKNNFGWGQRFGPLDDIYYGIFDDDGRMVIAICYNQDIGDGWEWPNRNLADASTVSFQMAINFIIYALTH